MSELYPNIVEFRSYWRYAPMVCDTFAAFEASFSNGFDGVVCASKAMVECACKTIVEELDDPDNSIKDRPNSPIQDTSPTISSWMAAATELLNLTNHKTDPFNSMVGQYNQLAAKLGTFRNKAGNVGHGQMGFAAKLTEHHRRSAVLVADTVIGFLHGAYLDHATNPASSFEPYERFAASNVKIDQFCGFHEASVDDDGNLCATINVLNRDRQISLTVSVSELLFGVDRQAYREAQLATAEQKEAVE